MMMIKTLLKSVLLISCASFAVFSFTACSHKASSQSTVTLTLPDFSKTQDTSAKARAEKSQLTAMGYSTVTYVSRIMLNVHGSGISNPIFFVAQSHDVNHPVPSSIQLTIPTGSDRLIQALLLTKTVIVNSNGQQISDGKESFYYGDVLKSLSGDDSVDLALSSVLATPGAEGAIAGRIIDAVTGNGPTGLVNVQFAPVNGSLPMTVMQTEIHGGWFNFKAFEGLPFQYVMQDGRVLLPGASIAVQPSSLPQSQGYIVVPPFYKVAWDGSTEVSRAQVPGNKYLVGYFGDGVPSTNKFCFDNSTAITLNDAYSSGTTGSTTFVHWAGSGAPTAALAGVAVGGVSATNAVCGTAADLYTAFMRVNTAKLASSDQIVDYVGPFGLFIGHDSNATIFDAYVDGSNNLQLAWSFLPGAVGPARVTSVGLFTRNLPAAPSNNNGGDPDYMVDGNVACDRLTDPNFLAVPFTFQTAVQATAGAVNTANLGALTNATDLSSRKFQVVACPLNDFNAHYFSSALGTASMGGSGNSNPQPTQLIVKAADNTSTTAAAPKLAPNNLCFPVTVQATDSSGTPTYFSAQQTLQMTLSGDAGASLHLSSNCSDTLTPPYSISNFNRDAVVYVKTASAVSAYQVGFAASSLTGVYYGNIGTPTTPLTLVSTLTPSLYANTCEPIRFTAVGANGVLSDMTVNSFPYFAFNLSGSTLHYYQDQDGQCAGSVLDASNFQIPPSQSSFYARIKYYAGTADGTLLTLTPSLSSGSFTGGTIAPLTTTLHQPGAPARVEIMLSNQMSSGSCQPFTAQLYDSQGHPTTNNGTTISLSFASTDGSSTFNTISSGVCGAATGTPVLSISPGASSSSGLIGYTPMTTGSSTVSATITAGAALTVDPRSISVGPAVANHIVVLLPGQTLVAGSVSGTSNLIQANTGVSITAVAVTPFNTIDTAYNGPLSLFSISGAAYTTGSQPSNFSGGYATISITPTANSGAVSALVQSNGSNGVTLTGTSNNFYIEPNPAGTPRLRVLSVNGWWDQGRCEQLLVSLNHATSSTVSGSLAATSPVTVSLTSTGTATATFYAASDCTGSAVNQVTLAAGQRATIIGVITNGANPTFSTSVQVSATGYSSMTWSGSVNAPAAAGAPTNIMEFFYYDATSVFDVFLGTCTPLALGLHETNGSAVAASNITVTPSSSGLMSYYSDPACHVPVTQVTIPTGQSAVLYYGRATGIGTDANAYTGYNNASLTAEAHTLTVH